MMDEFAPTWLALLASVVIALALSGCGARAARGAEAASSPPEAASAAAECSALGHGLTRCRDKETGLACFIAVNREDGFVPQIAISCVRELPMQWQIGPGPKVNRRSSSARVAEDHAGASSHSTPEKPGPAREDSAGAGPSSKERG